MIRVLFLGDVIGEPGRRALHDHLNTLIDKHRVDFVIVNIENAAGGFGVTLAIMKELEALPIDIFSSGNHIWDKKEILDYLTVSDTLVRPANYPEGNPGRGVCVRATPAGVPVALLNLEGQVFMKNLESPFRVAERELAKLEGKARVIIVDMHAEATSEKAALGHFLDGRVSAVVGTHTHVQTADERILAGGTAYMTDVGMCGPHDSVIGFAKESVIERFLYQTPRSFVVAKRDVRLSGALITVDETSGRATEILRLQHPGRETRDAAGK